MIKVGDTVMVIRGCMLCDDFPKPVRLIFVVGHLGRNPVLCTDCLVLEQQLIAYDDNGVTGFDVRRLKRLDPLTALKAKTVSYSAVNRYGSIHDEKVDK